MGQLPPCMAVCLFLCGAASVPGQTLDSAPASLPILTNISQIWELPHDERLKPHRIQTEVVIYTFDPEWNNTWGECQGYPAWLPISDSPTPFKPGQRVAIDGVVLPIREQFIWDKTQVHILDEHVETQALPVSSLRQNPHELRGHLILVRGLIDSLVEDATHYSINFICGDVAAMAYVLKGTNNLRDFDQGDFVRMRCVYAPQYDTEGDVKLLSLFVPGPEDIKAVGSLKTDALFARPLTPIDEIDGDTPTNVVVHVEGIVRGHESGKWVTLWDATGQITVHSRQSQSLRFGDRVEAVGYPAVAGVEKSLRTGLYRPAILTNPWTPTTNPLPIRLAERVRDLSREEAGKHQPVELRAIVTWSHTNTPFAFVQDASGGIRVLNPRWASADADKPGTIVTVKGEVCEGDFVPVITNAVLARMSYWNISEPAFTSLEQALTGVEDGRWVEMRGFVRRVVRHDGLVRFELSTSSGEFQAWVPAVRTFDDYPGSIIRIQGVCSAVCNSRHQLTGVEVWSPDVKYLKIDEPAPDDLFALPLRKLDSLRRFNLHNALDRQVRTTGTVVLHAPGRYVYVQDGSDSVFALSQQTEPLQPGDRVEVVGFPGNRGRRFLLREAVYRRLSAGQEPAPIPLRSPHSVNVELEGLLAKAEGVLLNRVMKEGEERLLLHSGDSVFEVSLEGADSTAPKTNPDLEPGSLLAVTGVYEVQSDEYGKPRSFLLRLRSWNDVQLLRPAPWWTLSRLFLLLLGVLVVFLIALAWGVLISRKNRLLSEAHVELQSARDHLEHRVEERTQELQQQVAAKERARAELSKAQKNLIQASRQAGMADVATGVLHNVGNVLNSVNVSTGLLDERLRRCSVESVARTAALLRQNQDQLGRFLTEDSRGRMLPAYLEKLGKILIQDKHTMQEELDSLGKNVDHIKTIVAMQQSFAKAAGVLEELEPGDLVEDALQINSISLSQHDIEVVRDYQPVPCVLVDRHKVLQILINLISNAKHALKERSSDRRLVLQIAPTAGDRIRISVSDNGVGIAPENLSRVFSQGFTTRQDGHGFGLHSGANAVRELGGSLSASSEGIGKGATFTLELPVAGAHSAEPHAALTGS